MVDRRLKAGPQERARVTRGANDPRFSRNARQLVTQYRSAKAVDDVDLTGSAPVLAAKINELLASLRAGQLMEKSG